MSIIADYIAFIFFCELD